jgi:predicted alpha/beta superfamily hydrolase
VPLTSAINGVDYALYVRTPVGYETGERTYPVIVTLDADYSFPIAAMHLEHLAARMNQAPEAILVSIGVAGIYPDVRGYRRERSRDYTPIFHPDGGYGPEFQRASGGGPAFLRMLTEEALPLVASRWRVDPDDRTLVGHSYGGLFTAWVLQSHPEAFSRYLMVSPSLWYANRFILDREPGLATTRLPRLTRAYLGVGSWEEQPENGGYMVSEMTRFAEMLAARGDPNLVVKSRVFEDETHASIFPACFSTGVRHLFGTMDG